MSYDGKLLRRAKARFDEQKQQREQQLHRRREQAYQLLPRVEQIDQSLRHTTPRIVAAAFRRGADPRPAMEALREENLRLQQERARLLQGAGLGADYLSDEPACGLCGDAGWINGGGMCRCLKAHYIREQIAELSRMLDLQGQNFEGFSLDWYSSRHSSEQGISPRENMEHVFEVCSHYARRFGPQSGSLLLSGEPGLGKTFLSACIARTVSERGFSVVYDTAAHVFALFEAQKFGREEEEAEDGVERVLRCDLLILDDLGTELITAFVQSALYRIVNHRLMAGRQSIISTNLPPHEIGRRYSPQILSRLEGEYQILPFFGEDIRKRKRQG